MSRFQKHKFPMKSTRKYDHLDADAPLYTDHFFSIPMAGGGVPSVSAALLLCIAATLFCANRPPRRLHVSNGSQTHTQIARHTNRPISKPRYWVHPSLGDIPGVPATSGSSRSLVAASAWPQLPPIAVVMASSGAFLAATAAYLRRRTVTPVVVGAAAAAVSLGGDPAFALDPSSPLLWPPPPAVAAEIGRPVRTDLLVPSVVQFDGQYCVPHPIQITCVGHYYVPSCVGPLGLVAQVGENTGTAIPAQALVKPIFTTFNAVFLPPFALMIVFPGWGVTKALMKSPLVPTTVSLLFIAELIAATQADYTIPATGAFDTERWQAAANYLLTQAVADPALMRDFAVSTPSYIAQDWLHVCAWDVIGARWIYLDGLEKGIWTIHSVFLCQAAGPTGWLAHSLTVALVRLVRPNGGKEGSES
jgi:hypothetical protein